MSTLYYTRIKFILALLPLLTASPLAGHAISVYAGDMEHGNTIDPKNLPLGAPADQKYSINTVRQHVSFMKTFLFERLAAQNAGKLRLTHIFPGLVEGPGFYSADNPVWFRVVWRLVKPITRFYTTSSEDCGAAMVFLGTQRFAAKGARMEEVEAAKGTDGEVGGGAYAVGKTADVGGKVAYPAVRGGEVAQRVWEHTMKVLGM